MCFHLLFLFLIRKRVPGQTPKLFSSPFCSRWETLSRVLTFSGPRHQQPFVKPRVCLFPRTPPWPFLCVCVTPLSLFLARSLYLCQSVCLFLSPSASLAFLRSVLFSVSFSLHPLQSPPCLHTNPPVSLSFSSSGCICVPDTPLLSQTEQQKLGKTNDLRFCRGLPS